MKMIAIDWEQRRYEIAKAMLPKASEFALDAANDPLGRYNEKFANKTLQQVAADCAVAYADALIEELKKEH